MFINMFYDILYIKPVNCTLKMPGIYAKFELFLHFVCTHLVVCQCFYKLHFILLHEKWAPMAGIFKYYCTVWIPFIQ